MLKQNYQRGFTLIELMTVVTIVAILAGIAYPSYQNYIHKTRQENARADLIENVRKLENYYNRNKSFSGFNSLAQNKSKDYFTLTGKYDDNSYQLTAKPTEKNKGEKQLIVYSSTDGTMICKSEDLKDCSRPF